MRCFDRFKKVKEKVCLREFIAWTSFRPIRNIDFMRFIGQNKVKAWTVLKNASCVNAVMGEETKIPNDSCRKTRLTCSDAPLLIKKKLSGGVSTIIAFVRRIFPEVQTNRGFPHDPSFTKNWNTTLCVVNHMQFRYAYDGPDHTFRFGERINRFPGGRDVMGLKRRYSPSPPSYLLDALQTESAYRRKIDNRFVADTM